MNGYHSRQYINGYCYKVETSRWKLINSRALCVMRHALIWHWTKNVSRSISILSTQCVSLNLKSQKTLKFGTEIIFSPNMNRWRWQHYDLRTMHPTKFDRDVPETKRINWILYLCFSSVDCLLQQMPFIPEQQSGENFRFSLLKIEHFIVSHNIVSPLNVETTAKYKFIEFVSPWLSRAQSPILELCTVWMYFYV